jgi:B12-binding domain/radical SAM domain protein of rhizo-twelve system
MRVALINPPWTFEKSIYFGCPEPHLPLEFGYAQALLKANGHEAEMFDCTLLNWSNEELCGQLSSFRPDFSVITTAPSYLFWRCAPPELRIPQLTIDAIRPVSGTLVAIGPHASTTPRRTLEKLGVDIIIRGEPEEILPLLEQPWSTVPSVGYRREGEVLITGGPHYSDMARLPALEWPDRFIASHHHHHHRFDAEPQGPGAEVEASRGCPYKCTFCAKENFRNQYRRRPLEIVLTEVDALLRQDVEYIYFIDEIFLPWKELLHALADRPLKIGIQTRIDLWNEDALCLLAAAHCVSIEAGVESITPSGRELLDKQCRLSTEDLTRRLIFAKRSIPFVQANLIALEGDDSEEIERWRKRLADDGVWANKPVPLFPYPGSPDYTKRWGAPDDDAWERAHAFYLSGQMELSDVQDQQPAPLVQLERSFHAN